MPAASAPLVTARVQLVSPNARLGDSYRGLVSEFAAQGDALVPFVLRFDHHDLAALLARLDDCSRGIGLPDGFVAHSTYWLVRNDTEVVGVSNLRHSLTPSLMREGGHIGYGIRPSARCEGLGTQILGQTLRRATDLGIVKVLLTCAKANAASVHVILRNGGVLDSEEYMPERGEVVQRYWIER